LPNGKGILGDRALKDLAEQRHAEIVHPRRDGWLRLVRSHVAEREHTGALNRLADQRWSQQDKLCVKEIIAMAFPLNSSWK